MGDKNLVCLPLAHCASTTLVCEGTLVASGGESSNEKKDRTKRKIRRGVSRERRALSSGAERDDSRWRSRWRSR